MRKLEIRQFYERVQVPSSTLKVNTLRNSPLIYQYCCFNLDFFLTEHVLIFCRLKMVEEAYREDHDITQSNRGPSTHNKIH